MAESLLDQRQLGISDADLDNLPREPKRNTATLETDPCLYVNGGLAAARFLLGLDPPEPVEMGCGQHSSFSVERKLPLERYGYRSAPWCANGFWGPTQVRYHAVVQIQLQAGPMKFSVSSAARIVITERTYRKFRQRFLDVCAEYGIDYPLPEPPPYFTTWVDVAPADEGGYRYVRRIRVFRWTLAVSWLCG